MVDIAYRPALAQDFAWIRDVVDEWWGRPVATSLPRLFLDHFYSSSLVAESATQPVGFLIGFDSPSQPTASYIHFVGVSPEFRRHAVGRSLYERFFEGARGRGRRSVSAITPSTNAASISFHRSLGFAARTLADYNREGDECVIFTRTLTTAPTRAVKG